MLRFWVLIIALASAVESHAVAMLFLRDSVLAEFTEAEIDSFKSFIGKELDTLPDGKIAKWQSGSSKRIGKLKPKLTYSLDDVSCRRTLFQLTGESKKSEQYQFEVCKEDGKWRILDTPAGSFSTKDWEIMKSMGTKALEYEGRGQPFAWTNSTSGNSGIFVPMEMEKVKGEACRDLAISIADTKGQTASGLYRFCQKPDGEWHRVFTDIQNL
jgi:surface antigen